MTEAEWLACAEPTTMLDFLDGKVSDRKLRLVAVACCRQLWQVLDADSRRTVDAAEQFADGQADLGTLLQARDRVAARLDDAARAATSTADIAQHAIWATKSALRNSHWLAVATRMQAEVADAGEVADDEGVMQRGEWREEIARQLSHIKEVVGNPFRAVIVDRCWLTFTVVSLADSIYADRAFDRLPILADALEDAGCDNRDILDHCRQPGEHARGCWVVDLVLGRK